MSYSDFTLADLETKLNLTIQTHDDLFAEVSGQPVSTELLNILSRYRSLALAIDTEKARSEYIVAPILAELKLSHPETMSLFSGIEFNIDKKKGLIGRCDFIVSKNDNQYVLTAPVVVMVEAKNDNIKRGIAQCGAEMVAAQQFNQLKNNAIPTIYGCVSTGTIWKFLKLEEQNFYIDTTEYYIDSLEKIMAILVKIVLS